MNNTKDKDHLLECLLEDLHGLYESYIKSKNEHSISDSIYGFNNAFFRWKQNAKRFLYMYYGRDIAVKEFNSICSSDVSENLLSELMGLFESLEYYTEEIPAETENTTPNIQIVNNNELEQTQSQTQNFKFINEILNQELTKEQVDQIRVIVESALPKEKKKQKILNSLIGFGENVAASILASLLLTCK